ncbi:MAG: LemA family protein [Actinobacteria bacterium]|nr:LemA family protein [Actinomycetota bacterium]
MNALWIVLIVVALLAVWVIFSYNRLVSRRNEVDNAWSQIDVQLKRRLDLIPNLVETVKGYADFEKNGVIFAKSFNFADREYFEAEAAAANPPVVKF